MFPGILLATVSLSFALLPAQERIPLEAQEQTATIHIRLLNGKTGQPIKGKQIFFDRSGRLLSHKEDKNIVTGPDGIANAVVPTTGYLVDPVIVDLHLCTKAESVSGRTEKAVRFSIAQILSSGVVAKNSCGKASETANPGELILWVRPMSALERLTD